MCFSFLEFSDDAPPMWSNWTHKQKRARPNKDRSLSTIHTENIAKGFWFVVCYVPKRNCRECFAGEFGRFFCLFVAVEGQTEIYVCANHQSTYIMLLKRYKVKQICKIALHSSRAQFDVGFSMMGTLVVKFDFRVVFQLFQCDPFGCFMNHVNSMRINGFTWQNPTLCLSFILYWNWFIYFLGGRVVIKFSRWILW